MREFYEGCGIFQRKETMKFILAAVLFGFLFIASGGSFNKQQHVYAAKTVVAQRVSVGEAKPPEPKKDPVAVVIPAPEPIPQLTDHESLMQQAGIAQADWAATDYIVTHESTWQVSAVNPSSGATGLCQALPASKMASEGEDYMTNPVTQLRWCAQYASSRYGSWSASLAFWQTNRLW